MEIGIKVGDVMTKNFVRARPETPLLRCAKKMTRAGSALVVEKNRFVLGTVSEQKIIEAITKRKDLEKIKIADVMSRKVISLTPETDIYDALVKMKRTKTKWLPVLNAGKLVGVLGINDILKIEPTLFDIVSQREMINHNSHNGHNHTTEKITREGYCDECGNYDFLSKVEGRFLCENCGNP